MFRLIITAIFSTTMMTLFSYLYEARHSSKFKEPQLLNFLLCFSIVFPIKPHKKSWWGWLIHYLIGGIFVLIFKGLIIYGLMEESFWYALLYGLLIGLVGIAGWKCMFTMVGKPPSLNKKHYYIHLWLDHLIFGATMGFVYTIWA